MKNVVMLLPLDPVFPAEGNVSKTSATVLHFLTKGLQRRADVHYQRMYSALQLPLTDLNDLLIEGHCGEEGQGHIRVWGGSVPS